MVDAAIAHTRFAADFSAAAFGWPCVVLPAPGLEGVAAESTKARYVTFLDPTPTNGVWAFARISDELGRRRPDIPLLVVEGRGTEEDLAACGLDLRAHGNLGVMPAPAEPRDYWPLTRVALVPTLGWDGPAGAESSAPAWGVPSLVADRGGLSEMAGRSGIVLPLPARLTPATRVLPTADEVGPWVDAIVRLWDDARLREEYRSFASQDAAKRRPKDLAPRYTQFLSQLRSGAPPIPVEGPARSRSVILVPHLHGVDWECDQGLRALEQNGIRVARRGGSSAIDAARNELASNALHDGAEAMLFIDADIGFDPADALRLMARPEPVVCGVYAKKGQPGLTSHFAAGTAEVVFGPHASGPYPVRFAATGFLMIKAWVLRDMIERLGLPLCNTRWGRGAWPFFMPMIIPMGDEELHYLGEDWAFSHRLGQIGITPLADTTIRLWHWGRHPFGWEDASEARARFRSYKLRLPE